MKSVDHHLQRQILKKLSENEALRFRDLKPDGLENNIFMYHLRLLLNAGLVEKVGINYTLAPDGLTYIDQISSSTQRPSLQPKVIVILVVQTKSSVVLLKRNTQPYINRYMLPSGKLHFGERLQGHADREVKAKLGIDLKLQKHGTASIAIVKNSKTITHILGTVYAVNLDKEVEINCSDKRFTVLWAKKSQLDNFKLLSVTKEIIALVNESDNFFIEDFVSEQD